MHSAPSSDATNPVQPEPGYIPTAYTYTLTYVHAHNYMYVGPQLYTAGVLS